MRCWGWGSGFPVCCGNTLSTELHLQPSTIFHRNKRRKGTTQVLLTTQPAETEDEAPSLPTREEEGEEAILEKEPRSLAVTLDCPQTFGLLFFLPHRMWGPHLIGEEVLVSESEPLPCHKGECGLDLLSHMPGRKSYHYKKPLCSSLWYLASLPQQSRGCISFTVPSLVWGFLLEMLASLSPPPLLFFSTVENTGDVLSLTGWSNLQCEIFPMVLSTGEEHQN